MPGFRAPLTQLEARRQLALPSRGTIALVLGGGLGLNVDTIAINLLNSQLRAQLLIVPGQNQAAQANLAALQSQYPSQVRVCGWTERMDLYMRAADVIVGKPGGISVAEAMACGRPLFATRSLGGQEGFNVRFLESNHVGGLVSDGQLVDRLQTLVSDPVALAAAQRRAWALGNRHGASRIAELLLDLSWSLQSQAIVRSH